MKRLLHCCGHDYRQDCMRRPPTDEQIAASVCPQCVRLPLFTPVFAIDGAYWVAEYLLPASLEVQVYAPQHPQRDEHAIRVMFRRAFPGAVYLISYRFEAIVRARRMVQPVLACPETREEAARTYAKDFLRPRVERGDSVQKACQCASAHVCATLYTVQIGGNIYYQGKLHHIKAEQIAIKEMAGEPCLHVFAVAELFCELGASPLKGPLYQLSIWESASA